MTTLRWGQHPLSFEIQSADRHVLARASVIFKPWQCDAASLPARVWQIDAVDDRAWQITEKPNGGDPLTRESIEAAVRSVEYLAAQTLCGWPSVNALHGALVARAGHAVLLLGRSEAGKSTLACSLWTRGWQLLGDDVALVDPTAGLAWPTPRRVSLREQSRTLLGTPLWSRVLASPAGEQTSEGCMFHPDDLDGSARGGSPASLAALVFLDRCSEQQVPFPARLAPAHALLGLIPYTPLALRVNAGEVIRRFRPLAERVPAWDLARGPLDEMSGALDAVLDGRA